MNDVGVGLVLQPDAAYLELLAPLLASVEYLEIAPETTWREDGAGELVANGFFHRFLAIGRGRPFVAHGVGLSVGSFSPRDRARRKRWLARIARDHAAFDFRWYTDHLGVSAPDGLALSLPLALPMTAASVRRVRASLRALRAVVPTVGVENSALYYLLGDPLAEPAFLRAITAGPKPTHLLLDLHNLHTMAENFGFDPAAYLEALPLDRVIEIHLAGGSPSDPRWLASRRSFVLDGHDASVPEAVWRLFDDVVPRCVNLRGVTLERMEGTVAAGDVHSIGEELARARRTLRRRGRAR